MRVDVLEKQEPGEGGGDFAPWCKLGTYTYLTLPYLTYCFTLPYLILPYLTLPA